MKITEKNLTQCVPVSTIDVGKCFSFESATPSNVYMRMGNSGAPMCADDTKLPCVCLSNGFFYTVRKDSFVLPRNMEAVEV